MTRRIPSPATAPTPLPTLASLLAAGTLAQGCAPVECGDARIDEVRAHGPRGVAALRAGRVREGLREVAVASGALPHSATRVGPVQAPGAEAVVTPQPVTTQPVPTPEPTMAPGQMMVVTPRPPPRREALRGDVQAVGPEPVESR